MNECTSFFMLMEPFLKHLFMSYSFHCISSSTAPRPSRVILLLVKLIALFLFRLHDILLHKMAGKGKKSAGNFANNWAHQFMSGLASVPRPGFNSTGREASLKLNAYPIEQFPTRDVYQYDVSVCHGKVHGVMTDCS